MSGQKESEGMKSRMLQIIFRPLVYFKYRKKDISPEHLLNKLNYPQGWYFMPHNKIIRNFIQWFCGVTGHELSETEWGYGGGDYADRWCRWCDKIIQVPKDSIRFAFKETASLMKNVGKEV